MMKNRFLLPMRCKKSRESTTSVVVVEKKQRDLSCQTCLHFQQRLVMSIDIFQDIVLEFLRFFVTYQRSRSMRDGRTIGWINASTGTLIIIEQYQLFYYCKGSTINHEDKFLGNLNPILLREPLSRFRYFNPQTKFCIKIR